MKRSNMTMTINDVAKLFRSYGIPIELGRLADAIADGTYPFGRVVKTSATGRRTFEIWRVDVEAFLESKIPKENIRTSAIALDSQSSVNVDSISER